ncbi:MAG: hypothetical protein CMQ41_04070 [Gammaproteobacteria bacterium]|nr:hypothetical protein [Gammaproteobacteria bacterium]
MSRCADLAYPALRKYFNAVRKAVIKMLADRTGGVCRQRVLLKERTVFLEEAKVEVMRIFAVTILSENFGVLR